MSERPTLDHLFIRPEDSNGERFELAGEECFHLSRVKRARKGEEVSWSDGEGRAGRAVLEEVTPAGICLRVLDVYAATPRRPGLHLFQALPKGSKMDDLIRRNVEAGVDEFFPLLSSRSLHRPGVTDYTERLRRWRKIAREASRQSRRDFLPVIHEVMEWDDCLGRACLYQCALIAWEGEKKRRVTEALPCEAPETVAMFIGPEGGLDTSEVNELARAGAVPVSLGRNILRTENAGMVLAVLIEGFYGII